MFACAPRSWNWYEITFNGRVPIHYLLVVSRNIWMQRGNTNFHIGNFSTSPCIYQKFIMGKWKCFSVLLRWSFILAYPKFVCFRCKNKVTTENLYRSIVSWVSRMGRRVFELVERKWGRGRRRSVGRGEWGERRGLRKEQRNRNGRNAEKRACSRRVKGNKWRREDFETSWYKF